MKTAEKVISNKVVLYITLSLHKLQKSDGMEIEVFKLFFVYHFTQYYMLASGVVELSTLV